MLVVAALAIPLLQSASQQPPSRPQFQKKTQPSDREKTPADIAALAKNSVAVIVAADETTARLGTGFFVNETGLMITNLHVVEGSPLVGVRLPDTKRIVFAKTVRDWDTDNDLVALQVGVVQSPPLLLGNSDKAFIGEPVIVVSNPEGLEQTVSDGLISALREFSGRKLLQITAPISSGSSGGPVFDKSGKVIGVVVSTLAEGQNLNFAIPINLVKPLLDSTREVKLDAIPKPHAQPHSESGSSEASRSQGEQAAAVQVMRQIADSIRQCPQWNQLKQSMQKKQMMHYRWHAGPPTDVRFDLQKSDSLVAPYTGIVEFTIHTGMTHWWPTPEQALADDCVAPLLCIDQPHRHVFRVGPEGTELQYRFAFDNSKGQWFQEEGAPSYCWEAIGYK